MTGLTVSVSVVLPAYNSMGVIGETMASILASSWSDFELVVVDDGSTDGTLDWLQAIVDPRVRILSQVNRGIGAARNRGIQAARGEFVAFIDHDDVWSVDYLETQMSFLASHPEIGAALSQWIYSDTGEPGVRLDLAEAGRIDRPLARMAEGNLIAMSSALVVRSDSLAGIAYPEVKGVMEDVPVYLELFRRTAVGLSCLEPKMTYRRFPGNTSGNARYFESGARAILGLLGNGALADRDALAYGGFVCRQGCGKLLSQRSFGPSLRLFFAILPLQLRLSRFRFVLGFVPALASAWLKSRFVPARHPSRGERR